MSCSRRVGAVHGPVPKPPTAPTTPSVPSLLAAHRQECRTSKVSRQQPRPGVTTGSHLTNRTFAANYSNADEPRLHETATGRTEAAAHRKPPRPGGGADSAGPHGRLEDRSDDMPRRTTHKGRCPLVRPRSPGVGRRHQSLTWSAGHASPAGPPRRPTRSSRPLRRTRAVIRPHNRIGGERTRGPGPRSGPTAARPPVCHGSHPAHPGPMGAGGRCHVSRSH